MAGPNLPIHMGINSGAVRNIPEQWDPRWFRRFITDHMKWADFRNAIAGPGITITGTEQQQGEISSTGGGGTITSITSTGGSVTITGGTGPVVDIEVAITPDTHPTPELPANDEFEYGTTVDTTGARFAGAIPWTVVNPNGSSTVTEGSLVMTTQGNGGVDHSIIEQPTTGTTWTYTCRIAATITSGTSEGGMIVGNAAGNFLTFDVYLNGGSPAVLIQNFTSPTVFAGNTYVSTTPLPGAQQMLSWLYMQITFDGTNLNFLLSTSGVPGSFWLCYSQPASTFLTTPSVIGLNVNAGATPSAYFATVFDWFRKTA